MWLCPKSNSYARYLGGLQLMAQCNSRPFAVLKQCEEVLNLLQRWMYPCHRSAHFQVSYFKGQIQGTFLMLIIQPWACKSKVRGAALCAGDGALIKRSSGRGVPMDPLWPEFAIIITNLFVKDAGGLRTSWIRDITNASCHKQTLQTCNGHCMIGMWRYVIQQIHWS